MGFGTGFVVHSLCGFASLRKKWQGRQLRSPAWQRCPQKTTKISHFYTSYSNHLHTPNSRDIRPRPCRKSPWSNAYYCLICTFENYSRTDFGFRHMIRTNMRGPFGHVTSQFLPRYHTQGKFLNFRQQTGTKIEPINERNKWFFSFDSSTREDKTVGNFIFTPVVFVAI